MISGSPQSYARQAPPSVSAEILGRALAQAERVERRGLTAVLTLGHLANQTGVPYQVLRDIVARRSDPYDEFRMRRNGSRLPRVISSPTTSSRRAQSWILRRILNRVTAHSSSYAYEPRKSIRACAEQHVGARWMLKVDLHDFFHSIDETQVYSVFLSLGYQPLVSFEMARICTRGAKPAFPPLAKYRRIHSETIYEQIGDYQAFALGFLPQGSPTSGVLANLVCQDMDRALAALSSEAGATFTRYADDMTFSWSDNRSRGEVLSLLRSVDGVVSSHGFQLHRKKTRIVPPGARKVVLGLLVDGESPRLTTKTRRRIDEHLRCADKYGCRSHAHERNFDDVLGLIRHVTGLLNFAADIDASWATDRRQAWEEILEDQGFRASSMYWL